jgi:4-methylaminobutanoate oxidase (formaldehyde-forming)
MGPQARTVLARICGDDLGNAAFPFGTARRISVAKCPVLALRVTYVGELGWELHMPTEVAVTVYEALRTAGVDLGLVNAGYRAIETLRLEKGYRAWGADIGPDHTPVETGLAWACKLKSGLPFRGRAALIAQQTGGIKKRLAAFTVEDSSVVLLGRETIYRDGQRVGWLSSGGYGHTLDKPIGYGLIRHDGGLSDEFILSGKYQLEVASERVAAKVHLEPLYDPKNLRVKA